MITEKLTQLVSSVMPIIVIFAIAYATLSIIGMAIKNKKNKKNDTPQEEKELDVEPLQETDPSILINDEYPYVKPYLLTKNEWSFYKGLKPITDKYKLHILSKVRMADIVQVRKDTVGKKYTEAFNMIKSKHVDFVLANPSNLAILCVIELDDKSHNDINAQKNDFFKDEVFKTIGLPIIRTRSIAGIEELICEKLNIRNKNVLSVRQEITS